MPREKVEKLPKTDRVVEKLQKNLARSQEKRESSARRYADQLLPMVDQVSLAVNDGDWGKAERHIMAVTGQLEMLFTEVTYVRTIQGVMKTATPAPKLEQPE